MTSASAVFGLAAATGTVGAVGMAGLTLGGGYGPLSGRYGLMADNLLAADVVLADGRLVTADQEQHPDLYWALRGGGGNFGVVTSIQVRLHPVASVLSGLVLYPWAQAGAVLNLLAEILDTAPDELTVQSGVISDPSGAPALFLSPTWSAGLDEGTEPLAALGRLGTPIMNQVGPLT